MSILCAAMSLDPFPENLDPQKLFALNRAVRGVIPLKSFHRLAEYLYKSDSEPDLEKQVNRQERSSQNNVTVELAFSRDSSNHRMVTGQIQACVNLCCQRCLGEVPIDLQLDINILVISDEAEAELLAGDRSGGREPDWVQASPDEFDGVRVKELLEDELILSLPIVAYHEDISCNSNLVALTEAADKDLQAPQAMPFASLSILKDALQEEKKSKT